MGRRRNVMAQREDAARQAHMAELIAGLTIGEGMQPSKLDGVKLMRADRSYPRARVLYEPCIAVIVQGRKRGFLGSRSFVYDPGRFLVLSIPLPFEAMTEVASDGKPMLGVSVRVDISTLGELILKMPPTRAHAPDAAARAVAAAPLDEKLGDAVLRLLECLHAPTDTTVLGPQLIREVTYRALCGAHGDGLRALASVNSRLAAVRRVLDRMHERPDAAFDVSQLADEVAMSPSAFHNHFRVVTSTSPLQYLKSVRLHRARLLMGCDGLNAGEASVRVGYQSPSQFCREFKRFFGRPPLAEAADVRRSMGGVPGEPKRAARRPASAAPS